MENAVFPRKPGKKAVTNVLMLDWEKIGLNQGCYGAKRFFFFFHLREKSFRLSTLQVCCNPLRLLYKTGNRKGQKITKLNCVYFVFQRLQVSTEFQRCHT